LQGIQSGLLKLGNPVFFEFQDGHVNLTSIVLHR